MNSATPSDAASRLVRFGVFEADLQTGELRKHGARVKLEGRPFQLLAVLLERPGELITREELQQKLWPADTFVDFEHGINTAVKRLRDVLGDSADSPRFIETLPRRGYRFIYPVASSSARTALQATARRPSWMAGLAVLIVISVLAVTLVFDAGGWRSRLFGKQRFERVLVLPIKNLTGDPAQEDLADGITDLLTTELAQVNSLSVISVTSAMHYKGSSKTLPQIAGDLNVDAVVEGSLQQSGNRIILTAQLVSAADRHLWAQTFEHDMRDALALRRQIAKNIIRELNVELSAEEESRLQRVRAVHPEAQLAYMKGRHIWWRRITEEGYRKSIAFYQTAIEKDPNFAEAYSGLAVSYDGIASLYPAKAVTSTVHAAASKAIELDPELAEPHALLCWHDWNEAECRRALELNPNDSMTHLYYAGFLLAVNRREESLAQVRRAEQLDPFSAYISAHIVLRLNVLKRYEEAIAQGQKALELDPDFWLTYQWMGGAFWHLKQYDQAIRCWEMMVALPSGYESWALARLVAVYRKLGRKENAQTAFAELQRIAKTKFVGANYLALGYAAMGRKEEAIAILQRAQRQGQDSYEGPISELRELLGNDPRYQKILAHRDASRSANSRFQ
ncbi:MAG TPA: winged helix-turn-helix domain-containing protein [Candidatus Nitrosotenuis sp.]|nr:winged helix-turn-helix domain-containing protein [Candidatus Nitrosotenuis sp.]